MTDANLLDNAQIMVKEWMTAIKKNPEIPMDEETMLGWFSSAFMMGYDKAKSEEVARARGRLNDLHDAVEKLRDA